jgi:cbb3-type cytochrome oxidase subunit 3
MNEIENQILLLFIFIFFIGLITYYYDKRQNIENFYDSNLTIFSNSDIPDVSIKTAINSEIINYNGIINRYSKINPSINVDNNGKLCDSTSSVNLCEINSSSSNKSQQCLVNGISSSCSKLFSDGVINNSTTVDLSSLISGLQSKIISESKLLIDDITYRKSTIDDTLQLLLNKQDLINQQIFTKTVNDDILISKKGELQTTSQEFEKNENDVFINQYNFKNFLTQNNNNNKTITLYRNILYGLIITIIIVGIFLYFVS